MARKPAWRELGWDVGSIETQQAPLRRTRCTHCNKPIRSGEPGVEFRFAGVGWQDRYGWHIKCQKKALKTATRIARDLKKVA